MDVLPLIIVFIALAFVLAPLVLGVSAMGKRTDEARVRSNKMMRLRVFAQAIGLGLLYIAWRIKTGGG